jgi:hypothetical protein
MAGYFYLLGKKNMHNLPGLKLPAVPLQGTDFILIKVLKASGGPSIVNKYNCLVQRSRPSIFETESLGPAMRGIRSLSDSIISDCF